MANPAASLATRQQVLIERLKAGNVRDLEKFLKQAETAIRLRLASGELTEFSRARLESQLAAVRSDLTKIYGEARDQVYADLRAFSKYAVLAEAKSLSTLTVASASIATPAAAQVYSAAFARPLGDGKTAAMLKPFIDGWADKAVYRVETAIRLGYFQGRTNTQMVAEIVGTANNRYRDGLADVTRRQAAAVVNTAVQQMASAARDATIMANADIVRAVEWVSTLDNRTTIQCQALDGQEFPIDSGPRPPLHVNCRSSVVPVIANKFIRDTLREGSTRASSGADGGDQVSTSLTYYDWLKKQPDDFQDVALGKTRAKLLRDGGLTSERFAELQLGKTFEPLTLKEMRDLEPVAFERAGL